MFLRSPTFLLLCVSRRRGGAAIQCGGPLGLTPPPRYYPHNVVPRDLAGGHNVRIARAALLAAVEEDEDDVVLIIFCERFLVGRLIFMTASHDLSL